MLRGVTKGAEKLGWQVIGFLDGFEGLLPPVRYVVLDHSRTAGIMQQGGTILGTTSSGHFVAKVGAGERTQVPPEIIEKARQTMADLEIDGLIVVGGDGSLTTALQLQEAGFSIIGVPKTIDNDLEATSMTFGFDSAVACVTDALDRLHSTAMNHKRVMVLEVMGHHAGWIALFGGFAEGKFGSMVSYQNDEVLDAPIADAVYRLRLVDPNHLMTGTKMFSLLQPRMRDSTLYRVDRNPGN